MTGSRRALLVVAALGAAALAAVAALGGARLFWRRAVLDTPVQRGALLAERNGCFGCHGPGGGQPIANPGAKSEEVPAWTGGTWMMWNRDEQDLRSWIVRGRREHPGPDAGALIPMPAYGDRLSAREIDDLVAYVLAASHFGAIDDEHAAAGHEVAYRLGCFGCHGPEGRGLVMNPGSLKGYIPAWDGDDFADLVRDDAELRQWVEQGVCKRLQDNLLARQFLDSQAIKMPAYRGLVTEDDIRGLTAYVHWVRLHLRTGKAPSGGK